MHFSTRKRTDNNHTLVTTPPAYLVCLLWRAPFCSRTYHGSTSRTRRVISVVGASRLLAPASRSQPSPSQSPLTSHPRLRLSLPVCVLSVCTEPHLTSPRPYPLLLRRRRPRSAPSSAPLVITTAHIHAHPRPPPTTICSITTPEAVAGHVLHPSP